MYSFPAVKPVSAGSKSSDLYLSFRDLDLSRGAMADRCSACRYELRVRGLWSRGVYHRCGLVCAREARIQGTDAEAAGGRGESDYRRDGQVVFSNYKYFLFLSRPLNLGTSTPSTSPAP